MWMKHAKKGLAGGALTSFVWWATDTRPVRSWRIRRQLSRTPSEFCLNDGKGGFPYIAKEPLTADLEHVVSTGGVKILWGVQGSGKTTTVRKVLAEMQREGQISGSLVIVPPYVAKSPAEWFCASFKDWRGKMLANDERIADMLVHIPKPFVIVLDQMENQTTDESLRVFVKSLAEDSVLTKSYAVVLITADAFQAATMHEWNGRQKITMLGERNPLEYKWGEQEVTQWITEYRAKHPSLAIDEAYWEKFHKAAINAGTPGFLAYGAAKLQSRSVSNDVQKSSEYYSKLWKLGKDTFKL